MLRLADTLTDSTAAAIVLALIKPLILIVAFAAIPMSFKLAISAMGQIGAFINGVGQKGRAGIKGSDMYKEGKRDRKARQAGAMAKFASTRAITSLTHSNSALKRAAGHGFLTAGGLLMMNAPKTPATISKSIAKGYKDYKKALDTFDTEGPETWKMALLAATGDPTATANLRRQAPHLLPYTRNVSGAKALADRVGKFMNPKLINALRTRYGPAVAASILGATQEKFFKSMPFAFIDDEDARTKFANTMSAGWVRDDASPDMFDQAIGTKTPNGYVRTAASTSWAKSLSQMPISAVRDSMYGPKTANDAKRSVLLKQAMSNSDVYSQSTKSREALRIYADSLFTDENMTIYESVLKDMYPNEPLPATPVEQRNRILQALGFDPQNFVPRPHPSQAGFGMMVQGQRHNIGGQRRTNRGRLR